MKKKFQTKNLWKASDYNSYYDVVKERFTTRTFIRLGVVVVCIALVVFLGSSLLQALQWISGFVQNTAVQTFSKEFGSEMQKDDFGNINILLVGHGGGEHHGANLADTIIVASRNPKLGAISMVSVPRDLFVYAQEIQIKHKINTVFAVAYNRLSDFGDLKAPEAIHELKLSYAAEILASKLEDVTGLKIPYYAVVNFEAFTQLVDNIGGLTVDVPRRLYDTAYPEGKDYTTFEVQRGEQIFDGETALKYARSRHSTSDFSRSSRQQQIIWAIVHKLRSSGALKSMSKLKQLYEDYTQMVHTNISIKEIIGMVQFADKIEHVFSFVFTTECSYASFEMTPVACFLYSPARDLFDGMSVILPNGATAANVSFYDYTQNFVFYVAHNQEYLIENPGIEIQNGIDKTRARQLGYSPSGHAGNLSVKLKKYAFNMIDINNAEATQEQTAAYINTGIEAYHETVDMLKMFFDINDVYTNQTLSTGVDMLIILGNDYLEKMGGKRFNFEM